MGRKKTLILADTEVEFMESYLAAKEAESGQLFRPSPPMTSNERRLKKDVIETINNLNSTIERLFLELELLDRYRRALLDDEPDKAEYKRFECISLPDPTPFIMRWYEEERPKLLTAVASGDVHKGIVPILPQDMLKSTFDYISNVSDYRDLDEENLFERELDIASIGLMKSWNVLDSIRLCPRSNLDDVFLTKMPPDYRWHFEPMTQQTWEDLQWASGNDEEENRALTFDIVVRMDSADTTAMAPDERRPTEIIITSNLLYDLLTSFARNKVADNYPESNYHLAGAGEVFRWVLNGLEEIRLILNRDANGFYYVSIGYIPSKRAMVEGDHTSKMITDIGVPFRQIWGNNFALGDNVDSEETTQMINDIRNGTRDVNSIDITPQWRDAVLGISENSGLGPWVRHLATILLERGLVEEKDGISYLTERGERLTMAMTTTMTMDGLSFRVSRMKFSK